MSFGIQSSSDAVECLAMFNRYPGLIRLFDLFFSRNLCWTQTSGTRGGTRHPIWRAPAVRFAQRFFRNLMECGTKRRDRGSGEHEFLGSNMEYKEDLSRGELFLFFGPDFIDTLHLYLALST